MVQRCFTFTLHSFTLHSLLESRFLYITGSSSALFHLFSFWTGLSEDPTIRFAISSLEVIVRFVRLTNESNYELLKLKRIMYG
jgi:hypothetical protein